MKPALFLGCVVSFFLYFAVGGCTDPKDLVAPTHNSRVPEVSNLRSQFGTVRGNVAVLLNWEFDTLNSNMRMWEIKRNFNDTAKATYKQYEYVYRPTYGFPSFWDTTAYKELTGDSLNIYYQLIPNGHDNFVGKYSDVLHVILRRKR